MTGTFFLEIIQQPPPLFYNQQFGKRHSFSCKVQLKSSVNQLSSDCIVLKLELVYADDLSVVQTPKVFKILAQNDIDNEGLGSFAARINDVSRNHQNRSFRIRVSAVGGEFDVRHCVSSPILVKSKQCTKKIKNHQIMFESTNLKRQRETCDNPPISSKRVCGQCPATGWEEEARCVLRQLSWAVIGYERNHQSSTIDPCVVNTSRPIVECPMCKVVCRFGQERHHLQMCPLRRLLTKKPAPHGELQKDIPVFPPASPDSVVQIGSEQTTTA